MQFGNKCSNDIQRVAKSMAENQLHDVEPSLKTLVGQDTLVMNLRPVEKAKHLHFHSFRYGNSITQNEKFKDKQQNDVNRYMTNDMMGLPHVNKR